MKKGFSFQGAPAVAELWYRGGRELRLEMEVAFVFLRWSFVVGDDLRNQGI
jgi:hypothetical protein